MTTLGEVRSATTRKNGTTSQRQRRHPNPKKTTISTLIETRPAAPDYAAIKQRQQATWASGDLTVIGTTLQIVGETLGEAADVRALDVAAGNFDVVLSTFGAMFAPDQERTAREMLRLVRSGGRIGMANWTPEGFVGHLPIAVPLTAEIRDLPDAPPFRACAGQRRRGRCRGPYRSRRR